MRSGCVRSRSMSSTRRPACEVQHGYSRRRRSCGLMRFLNHIHKLQVIQMSSGSCDAHFALRVCERASCASSANHHEVPDLQTDRFSMVKWVIHRSLAATNTDLCPQIPPPGRCSGRHARAAGAAQAAAALPPAARPRPCEMCWYQNGTQLSDVQISSRVSCTQARLRNRQASPLPHHFESDLLMFKC